LGVSERAEEVVAITYDYCIVIIGHSHRAFKRISRITVYLYAFLMSRHETAS
jgi:hypothetical protein